MLRLRLLGPVIAGLVLVAPAPGSTLRVPSQYATIQAAVDAAGAGDRVLVSSGVYAPFQIVSTNAITVKGNGGVVIDATDADSGILVTFSSAVRLVRLEVRNARANGISISSGSVSVEKCTILHSGRHGILVFDAGGSRLTHDQVEDSEVDGIQVRSDGVLVDRNKVARSAGNGLTVVGDNCTISRNLIVDSGVYGLQIGETGALVTNVLALKNQIDRPQVGGIMLLGQGQSSSILENTVRDPGSTAIHVGHAGASLDGNRISGAGRGMLVLQPDCRLSNNRIKDSAADGLILFSGSERSILRRNRVKRSGDDGIEVLSSGNRLVRNWSKRNADFDLVDHQGPGANTFVKNRFGSTSR